VLVDEVGNIRLVGEVDLHGRMRVKKRKKKKKRKKARWSRKSGRKVREEKGGDIMVGWLGWLFIDNKKEEIGEELETSWRGVGEGLDRKKNNEQKKKGKKKEKKKSKEKKDSKKMTS
jgi:hypothetical protein